MLDTPSSQNDVRLSTASSSYLTANSTAAPESNLPDEMNSEVAVFVQSLKQSRANVLATGAYTENDELIKQMDERIARYSTFLREKRF